MLALWLLNKGRESMSIQSTTLPTVAKAASARQSILLQAFAATLFLSAFLLFSLQPFFTKMVLPKLGGSPAVWSVAMVFFQAILLLGYGYAHLLASKLSLRQGAVTHLAVMAVAFVALPVAIPAGWAVPPESGQSLWLIGLFTVVVGLPFFAVSANGPLLQAWFSRSRHPHANDPYFLYGASNIGSFASLLLYIVAFEPLMTLTQQSAAWTAGFAVLAIFIAVCALLVGNRGNPPSFVVSTQQPACVVDLYLRCQWVALAAVPSGLLVAVTAHVSMDIASTPFLWVVPLALFLLTFVLAFARKPLFSIAALSQLAPALAALVFVSSALGNVMPVWFALLGHLGFFFVAALLAHSVLVSKRPAASGLTGFYFWMSLGGVLGGAFTALLSPAIFNWVAEYPLLILAALACRPQVWSQNQQQMRVWLLGGLLVAVLINNPLIAKHMMPAPGMFHVLAITALAVLAVAIRRNCEARHLAFSLVVVGLLFSAGSGASALSIDRSFYGVVKTVLSPDGKFNIMAHGTTEHGAMRVSEAGKKPTPVTYYHQSGGIAAALFAAQEKIGGQLAQMGAVGLGAGAILCHRKPGETWTSYEIDTAVVDTATNPALFGFVAACGNGDPVIVGDGRLKLADEPDGKFDYLLIDAFSSDSIPVHLLTIEALQLYRSKLKRDAILAIHISNRYMELRSVVAALARQSGMSGRAGIFYPPQSLAKGEHVNPGEVVVLADNETALGSIVRDNRWEPLDPGNTTPWTDDYSNVLAAIYRNF